MLVRLLLLSVLITALPLLAAPALTDRSAADSDAPCDITVANGETPPDTPQAHATDWYGSGAPGATFWLLMSRGTGIVERPPQLDAERIDAYAQGYPYGVVFFRAESIDIDISATSADGQSVSEDAFTLAADDAYLAPGYIHAAGHLPADGCWTFTATDGDDTLVWTTLLTSPFADCPVTSGADDDGTLPHDIVARWDDPDRYFGENGLYIDLGDPDQLVRRYAVGSPLVSETGAITDRFMWYRDDEAAGDLAVTVAPGRYWYPDEPQATAPESPHTRGPEFNWITFPGPGCWEVTGTSGGTSITFTIRLEIVPPRD